MRRVWYYYFLVGIIFVPSYLSHAQIIISEIMYDIEGADTNREWIEVQNTGSSSIDLTGWKFFEDDTNHGLTLEQGDPVIPPSGFAVIVNNLSGFLGDNPSFTGVIFDSSFSLNNTGETLAIRNQELVDMDTVTYSSEIGGGGDGESLQKIGSGWIPSSPTPGFEGEATPLPQEENSTSTSPQQTNQESGQTNQSKGSFSVEQTIFPNAGKDKKVVAGATILFEGEAFGIKKEPLINARFLWNFGDGGSSEGKSATHTYMHPGEYILVLNVSSGERSYSDRALIEVIESPIFIKSIVAGTDGYIEVINGSKEELDISWWQFSDGFRSFAIPKGTIILGEKSLKFSNSITGMDGNTVSFLYPNGRVAYVFKPIQNLKVENSDTREKISIANNSQQNVDKQEIIDEKLLTSSISDGINERETLYGGIKWYLFLLGVITTGLAGIFLMRFTKRDDDIVRY